MIWGKKRKELNLQRKRIYIKTQSSISKVLYSSSDSISKICGREKESIWVCFLRWDNASTNTTDVFILYFQ